MNKTISNTTCHCLKMRRSAENVIHFYDDILASSGLTVRQYSLLNKIKEYPKSNMRELGEYTELDRSTLARSLKPLIKEGYITDTKDKNARDSKLVLSKEGAKVCDKASKLWDEAQERYEKLVGKQNVQQLEQLLEKLQNL